MVPHSSVELSATFSKALVLTYEGACDELLNPYFSHRWKPLQPLTMYGRWAKMEPECEPEEAVWYAWKDRSSNQLSLIRRRELSAQLFQLPVCLDVLLFVLTLVCYHASGGDSALDPYEIRREEF